MEQNQELKTPVIVKVLCFLIPIIGIIGYVCTFPINQKYAKTCGKMALASFITVIAICLFVGIIIAYVFSGNISAKASNAQEETEITTITDCMVNAQMEAITEYYLGNGKINASSIVKNNFPNYTIVNNNLTAENSNLKGNITVRNDKGNTYNVDFTNSKVTKK